MASVSRPTERPIMTTTPHGQVPEALRLADWLQNAVATYPQTSEDEPGGYCQEVDQVMDEAAAELRRLHAAVDGLRANATEQYLKGHEGVAAHIHALYARSAELAAQVEALQGLAATCYAGLGAECNLPENWLDALNAAANGEPFTTSGLLPYKAQPSPTAQAADSVLEDAARYRAFIECGQPICFMGEEYYGKAALDAAIDATMNKGGA